MYATDAYYHSENSVKNRYYWRWLVGCEVGAHLANTGHEVEVVEMGSELAPEDNPFHHCGMMAYWSERPIHGTVNTTVTRIAIRWCLRRG